MSGRGSPNLAFSVQERAGGLLVTLDGELGLPPNTDLLQEELARISAQRPPLVVFDLTKLTFMSSQGIGMLAESHRGLRQYGGHIRLSACQPKVMEVLERCKMTRVFEIFENSDAAFGAG
ncbi:MAG: STAS domain-containing protein [Tepidisphaeraceae bacterium]